MQTLNSKLPPLKSLVAFEAVARHSSLTRAGEELSISREAVSRQIRVLEEHLGIKLFARLHRSVALTPPGRKFVEVVRESLENVAYIAGAVSRPGRPYKITVSATIAITSFWLTPRLARFRDLQSNVEIHVAISDRFPDMLGEDIDVGVRYGDGRWPGVTAIKLFDIETYPVCSPQYLENAPPLDSAEDLLNHSLINLDGMMHANEDWLWFLNGHNVRVPASFKMVGFDSFDNVIQMAQTGHGIALSFSGLIEDMLADGRLVRPLDCKLARGMAVYLAYPANKPVSPQVQNFIDWIIEEAGA